MRIPRAHTLRIATYALAAFVSANISHASASVLLDDGLTHIIDSVTPNSYVVQNGSDVRVVSGGSILGDGSNSTLGIVHKAAVSTYPSSGNVDRVDVTISGNGRIEGGTGEYAISRLMTGTLRMEDDSYIRGGTTEGIALYAWGTSSNHGAMRTYLSDRAFIDGDARIDGYVSISDHAVIAGDLYEAAGGISLEMDGGLIQGRVRAGSLIDHTAIIRGGSILGGYGGNASSLDFSMRDGRIANGWAVNTTNLLFEMYGGRIDSGMWFGSIADPSQRRSSVTFFGGSVDAALDGWLLDFRPGFEIGSSFDCSANTTSFSIFGGQFGYSSAGNGIHLDLCADVDVYGRNLRYENGFLTGFLADGNWLNVAVTSDERWAGALRLHDVSVPEPGTLSLFGLALIGAGLARRQRKHAAQQSKLPG